MTGRRLTLLGLLALAVGTPLLAAQPAAHAPSVRTVTLGPDPQALALAPHAGRVVVATQGDLSLRLFNVTSGRLRATSSVPGPPAALLVDEAAQRVWVSTSFGIIGLYDLHRSTPITMIVPNDTQGVSVRSLVADAPRRHVVLASENGYGSSAPGHGVGYVSILDARSGALVHVTGVGNLPAALAIDARTAHIFVASLGPTNRFGDPIGRGSVSMLDAWTGYLVRTVPLGIAPDYLAIDETTNRVFIATSALSATASLHILDATSGRLLHTIAIGPSAGAPLVDQRHGHVFVANTSGLLMLDARDGHLLRRIHILPDSGTGTGAGTGAGADVHMLLDGRRDRVIVLAGSDLALVDAQTGALVRAVQLDTALDPFSSSSSPLALDERRGLVYVTQTGPLLPAARPNLAANPAGRGTVRVLDVRTGATLQSITVGVLPDLVAVDAQTGRAFVVNRGCPDPDQPCGPPGTTPFGWLPSGLRRWLAWLPRPARVEPGGTLSVVAAAR